MISARQVALVRDGRTVLADVTLTVERGEAVRIGGGPSSDRTILLRVLATLIAPSGGTVSLDGSDATRQLFAARKRITYVDPGLLVAERLSVGEYLWIVTRARGLDRRQALGELIARAGLNPRAEVERLPTGERATLALVAALLVRPEVLVIDNGLRNVPSLRRSAFVESIGDLRRNGTAVIVAADQDDELTRLCSRVVMLRAGRLESGPPLSALSSESPWVH